MRAVGADCMQIELAYGSRVRATCWLKDSAPLLLGRASAVDSRQCDPLFFVCMPCGISSHGVTLYGARMRQLGYLHAHGRRLDL